MTLLRRAITWSACALCLLLIPLWFITRSNFFFLTRDDAAGSADLRCYHGALCFFSLHNPSTPRGTARYSLRHEHAFFDVSSAEWTWLPSFECGPGPGTPPLYSVRAILPLWIPFLPLALLSTRGILRARRAARRAARLANSCPHCLYSRAGLAPDAPCPECGRTL